MPLYRCLAECEEWEECLELLGGLDIDAPSDLTFAAPPCALGSSLDYISAICLLRGRVFDALENFPRAVKWYKAALQRDPFNHEAFHRLIACHKLTESEEMVVVHDLASRLPHEHRWLGLLYRTKCRQADQGGQEPAERALRALENEPPNLRPSPADSGAAAQQPAITPHAGGKSARRGSTASMGISPIQEESENDSPASAAMTPAGSVDTTAGAGDAAGEGWGLADNADVAASKAELLFRRGNFQEAHALTASILERDPYAEAVLPVHLAAAVHLGKKNELFLLSHKLIKAHPLRALPWYAAGCYYFTTRQYLSARQYFGKATGIDRHFAPAWIAFALAFAAQDETDQAMAAFRTAARLFPGLHEPLLGMGLEYSRMNNLPLAEQMLLSAYNRCPGDPLIAHEIGTLAYRCARYVDAADWLGRAVTLAPKAATSPAWEVTWVNLGHALRKLRRWEEAAAAFDTALGLAPHQPGTNAALGYCLHLAGNLGAAIECYHKALGLRSEDAFVSTMLGIALQEESEAALTALELSA